MSQQVRDFYASVVSGLTPTSGDNHSGYCPIHGEEAGRSRKSFSVNVETGMWQCFALCGAGTLGTFLKKVGTTPSKIDRTLERLRPHLKPVTYKKKIFEKAGLFHAQYPLPERILGLFEWCPSWLVDQGFDEEVLRDNDVGYDREYERITFPVRDLSGILSGIVGRNTLPGSMEKYKVYKAELTKFDGVPRWYNFDNHEFIWRWDKFYPLIHDEKAPTIYICEGFKACLWMVQHGYLATGAIMGAKISDAQVLFLQRLGGNVVICLDNNRAGHAGVLKLGYSLPGSIIRVMNYPNDEVQQPDDLSSDELHEAIESAKTLIQWRRSHVQSYGPAKFSSWRKGREA